MSSSILHLKPEEIDAVEKRGKYAVSIIGCGRNGVLQACLFADAGFRVICVDTDQTVVNHLGRGKAFFLKPETEAKLKNLVKTGRISVTNDAKAAVSQSDAVIITVPVQIDNKEKPDYSEIESACKQVGASLRHGSLVIVSGFTGINNTGGLIKELLENTSGFKVGTDLGLAYSPFQNSNEQAAEAISSHERIVAAIDKNSLNAASTLLETIAGKGVKKIENMKTVEAAIVFEAVQRDVNVALSNELALFCEKAGIDYLEASRLNSINNCKNSWPTLTDGNTQTGSYLLLEDAENVNAKLRIPAIAAGINEEVVTHAITLVRNALQNCGKTLRRARISLLGISQTANMKDSPKKAVRKLIDMLEAKGAKINIYDPYFSSSELTEVQTFFKKSLNEALEGADCIMIMTAHDQFKRLNLKKLKVVMKMPAAIVDFEGIFEPDKIEEEGFIYRGFGRGVWTK